MGGGLYLEGQPRPHSMKAETQRSPILGFPLFMFTPFDVEYPRQDLKYPFSYYSAVLLGLTRPQPDRNTVVMFVILSDVERRA